MTCRLAASTSKRAREPYQRLAVFAPSDRWCRGPGSSQHQRSSPTCVLRTTHGVCAPMGSIYSVPRCIDAAAPHVLLRTSPGVRAQGIQFSVVITEGRPDETGLTMAQALDNMRVPTIAILDSAVAYALEAFRCALPAQAGHSRTTACSLLWACKRWDIPQGSPCVLHTAESICRRGKMEMGLKMYLWHPFFKREEIRSVREDLFERQKSESLC